MSVLRLKPPIYLLTSTEGCYRCGRSAPVVALACRSFVDKEEKSGKSGDPVLVHNIKQMPDTLLKLILDVHPHYQKRYSRMAETEYFMNICPGCSAHFGDFFMFSEPEGAFFPMTDEATAAITIRKLPVEDVTEIDGSYSMGIGPVIFELGKML